VKTWGTSTCGLLFSVSDVAMAGLLFYLAFTCSGWVCDLVALPALFPFGFPIGWMTDWVDSWFLIPGHTPTFHLRNWYFIIPTVIVNAIFYYWLGKFASGLAQRLLDARL